MPKKIFVAVNDMFFAAKIRGTAEPLGVELRFVNHADQIIETARREQPDLIIFDLNDPRCRPLDTVRRLKADPMLVGIKTIGYLSHVQTDLHRQATEAGFDRVLPKSAFSHLLASLLSEQL